ncbi:right-handed parallel beta-helix repeat-containing protein, partial [Salinispora arenicola]|nr:right-handed parallel beta-helix repeat-containing protein [Salinispora arenicola]
MNQQDHIQEPEPGNPGRGHRARSRRRWWAIGLAGVTGLALTTVGLATAPTADAVGRTLAADGRLEKPGQSHGGDHRDDNRGGHDNRSRKKPKGVPVPCDADKLIAAITLANARGGA